MSKSLRLLKAQSRSTTLGIDIRQDSRRGAPRFRSDARKRPRVESPKREIEDEWQDFEAYISDEPVESVESDEMPTLLESVADSNSNNAIFVINNLLESIENATAEDPIYEALANEPGSQLSDLAAVTLPSIPLPPEPPQQDFSDDFEDLAEDELAMSPNESMLPPSRRSSVADLSEEVPHKRATWEMKTFPMALGLWCETSGITRQSYQSLLEVFDLLEDLQTLKDLPRSVTTLKKYVNAQLPLMKLRRQELDVVQEQLPTQSKQKEVRVARSMMYFFDPIDLFKTVLSSAEFRAKIHTGMACFVDQPSELYHSLAWASSIKACSGEYVFYSDQTPIFPSDVVYYCCQKEDCFCRNGRKFHMARVTAIGKDRTGTAESIDQVKILANPLYVASAFGLDESDFPMPANSKSKELFLSDQETVHLSQDQIHAREADVHFDYRYEGSDVRPSRNASAYTSRFVVRQIFELKNKSTRPLQLSAPIRGALELSTYGRAHLTSFSTSPCLSIPLLTFIDAFGLYRNMYRSLMGIYVTIAGLSWRERKRRANVLPLALGPHASDFGDVIKVLEPGLAALDRGLKININGVDTFVCVYTMAFTGDMKQQQDNSGFMSPIANRGCSKCLVTKKQKADLTFNIVLNARYHHRVLYERIKGDRSADSAKFFQSMGMRSEQTPLITIAPSLDIIRSRPGDVAHSEYAGIAKQAQSVLFAAILTDAGANAYCAELRHFPFPPGWGRLQSPKYHISSYRMQECGRISIITPLLLRTWLQPKWINPMYLRAAEATMSPALNLNGVDSIVACYAAMAKSNTVVLTQTMSSNDRQNMMSLLLQARKAFQRLYQCAALACSKNFKRGDHLISSRHTTPINLSDDESEAGSTFEDSELQYLGRSEYEHLAETFEIEGGAAKQAAAFRNVMARPNVHAALHYEDVATEYATPNNCTTLSGEDKHRFFKKAVTQTNFRDVEKVLLSKESLHQTLRFIIIGSHAATEPRLTAEMLRIHSKCPTLLTDLLPYSELGSKDDDEPQSQMAIIEDSAHERPLALACLDRGYVQRDLSLPLWPGQLALTDPFLMLLQQAYEEDYEEPNIIPPRRAGLQWCQKLSFTDRISEHRIVFGIGDFITVRNTGLARIDGVFLHELSRGRVRLFARVTMVEDFKEPKLDPILKVPYQKLSKTVSIVGLPNIDTKKHYVLHVNRKERDDGTKGGLERGGQALLLNCEYNIEFM